MGQKDDIQPFLDAFGRRVKKLRAERKLTQLDLADRTGMDIRQIQRIEGGDINTSIGNAYLIAKGLKVPLTDTFAIDDLSEIESE
ncbi:MAG: helix-turn-helix transcriptional regulator [Bacteroidota bacterium]